MAPAVEDLLTTFHPSGDAFAITAGDGRIKTWDVRNGEMRTEFTDIKTTSISGADIASNGHLAMDYTCMAWASLVTHGSAKKKKKGSKGGTSVVVLGTGSGDVVAWDTTLGELKWRTSDCHSGNEGSVPVTGNPEDRTFTCNGALENCGNMIKLDLYMRLVLPKGVKAVAFNKTGLRVYSAGHDGNVCELDSLTGQNLSKFRAAKIPLSCVAVSPDGGTVAAASAELKLFDLSSKKRLRKFPGHPAPVKALLFTPDGKYVLSCAVGERHVAMWQCEGSKADTGVVCSLSLEHPAVALDCTGFDKEGEILRIVAVSEGGVAYIWSAPTVAELGTAKATTINTKGTGKGSKSANSSVLAARFLEDGASVLVVHGTSAKPEFEKVVLDSQEGLSITVGAITNGALLPAITAGKGRSAIQEVTVLGPDNAGDALLPRPQIEIASAKKSKKKRRAELEDAEAEPSPKPMEDDTELPKPEDDEAMTIVEDEETMEDKLIALNLISDSPKEEIMGGGKAMVPLADSLQVLLTQGLHSEDNSLIEQCLAVQDQKMISKTIQRLRPADAAKLLVISISKLESRPQRAINLVPWVRAVLLQHASYIMSNPSMRPVLSTLYQIIEARLATFRPLVSLSGRLDLIMAQISANESQEKDLEKFDGAVIYDEEDSEPDAIDAMVDEDLEEDDDEEEDDEDDDEDAMDEDKTDGQVHGNGNGLSDGEHSEDIDN